MEIRPALQRMPAAIDNTASDASTVDAATTTAAENTDNAWPAAAPQLRDATQAAEPLQPSAAIQAPVSGEINILFACAMCISRLQHGLLRGKQFCPWQAHSAPTHGQLQIRAENNMLCDSCVTFFFWLSVDQHLLAGVGAVLQDSDASASEAPWDAVDCSIPPSTPLGLGCAVLPDFDYPEDNHAGLGSQAAARPLYDR